MKKHLRPFAFAALVVFLVAGLCSAQEPETCTISIQARFFVKYGPDAVPPNKEFYILLKGRTFYLMDTDPATALEKAKLKHPGLRSYGETSEYADLRDFFEALEASRSGFRRESSREFYDQAFLILKPHRLQMITTDERGRASFQPVKPGTYFVMGAAGGESPAIWSVKVEARPPLVAVTLDHSNQIGGPPLERK
jgi:hypothetical protein